MHRVLAVAVFSLAFACRSASGGGSPTEPTVGQSFDLAAGASAELDGGSLRLEFRRVANDSRCPTDVQCIQAGDAVVELAVKAQGHDETVQLHTSSRAGSEAGVRGYTIHLTDLRPAPRSDRPVAAGDYVATLQVDRE